MQGVQYLTTEEAGAYLRIKVRKVYEMAAAGTIPCSKVTGKWLFPRAALDRWIVAGLSRPEGFSDKTPPAIVGGSTDPLLEWAVRQSGSGLASLPEGSEAGLRRLAGNDVAIAAIHLHREQEDEAGKGIKGSDSVDHDANTETVRSMPGLHDAVVVSFARREQGIVTAAGNPLAIRSIPDALGRKARVALRQKGAGAQLLLMRLLAAEGIEPEALSAAGPPASTGQDLALAVRAGSADWGIATRAIADTHGLGFVPVLWESFDLVLRRRTYFEPGVQALMRFLNSDAFAERAAALGGYDVCAAGAVRLNM